MSFKHNVFKFLLIAALLPCIILTSCGKSEEKQKPEQQSANDQSKEEVPDQLKSIEENIEMLFSILDGPSANNKEKSSKNGNTDNQSDKNEDKTITENSQDKEKSDKQSQDQKSSGEESSIENKGTSSETKTSTQSPKPSPKDLWSEISPLVNTLHYEWNDFLPDAKSKGASKDLTDGFSVALNSLTNTVIGKNKTNTLLAASYLYSYIPDFYFLYKNNLSPEVKRVRYYTRNSMLNSMTANWTQSTSDMENLKDSWSTFKNTIDKKQHESVSKLDYSILELEKVTKEKNQPIVDIKGRVVLSNISMLEKESKENTSK